jgi:hypothetical protein
LTGEIPFTKNMFSMSKVLILRLFITGATLAVIAWAVYDIRNHVNYRDDAISVPGTVVESEASPVQYGSARVTVEFTDEEGIGRRFSQSLGGELSPYRVGEEVKVWYRAGAPEDARLSEPTATGVLIYLILSAALIYFCVKAWQYEPASSTDPEAAVPR